MAIAYLSLGSNIEPRRHLDEAVAGLEARFGRVEVSPLYQTAAVGFTGSDFLNATARIDTSLTVIALDAWLHALEDAAGRMRGAPRFSDRTLDVDLLLYDDIVLRGPGNLELPRPELLTQSFVLRPTADIAPDLIHPVAGRSLASLCSGNPACRAMRPVEDAGWPYRAGMLHNP